MKILEFRRDVNEKAARIGFVDIEVSWMGGFIIRDISIHEKENRKWVSFRSKKTDQKNEKGYDIWLPITEFKESKIHGQFASELFKLLDKYRAENSAPSNYNQNTYSQPRVATPQQNPREAEFNGMASNYQEGVPF